MVLVLIKVVVKVVRVFLTEALLARSFPRATRQRIAIVLTRPGYRRLISRKKNCSLMRSTLYGSEVSEYFFLDRIRIRMKWFYERS